MGDSHDNARAEAINNLCVTERIRQRGPCCTVGQVEVVTHLGGQS